MILGILEFLVAAVKFLFIIAAVVFIIQYFRLKKNDPKKAKDEMDGFCGSIVIIVICIIVGFILGLFNGSNDNNNSISSKPHTSKVQTKREKQESAAKASSDAEQKKTDEAVKKAREQNDKQNYADYKKELKNVPNETKGAITKAYIDPDTGYTVVVLNDSALSGSDDQTKEVARSAWNAMNNVVKHYSPLSASKNAQMISVQDSSGNELARTSMFGSFKYVNK